MQSWNNSAQAKYTGLKPKVSDCLRSSLGSALVYVILGLRIISIGWDSYSRLAKKDVANAINHFCLPCTHPLAGTTRLGCDALAKKEEGGMGSLPVAMTKRALGPRSRFPYMCLVSLGTPSGTGVDFVWDIVRVSAGEKINNVDFIMHGAARCRPCP